MKWDWDKEFKSIKDFIIVWVILYVLYKLLVAFHDYLGVLTVAYFVIGLIVIIVKEWKK